jgi:hypothetical protein
MRIRALFVIAIALVLAQTSFGGTVSSCSNQPGAPFDQGGTLYAYFDCSLYNDVASYTILLTTLMEDGGASLADNVVAAGYEIVINGDPTVLSDDSNGLFNESLWQTVLFFPGDQGGGYSSDLLGVYWAGAFPAVAVVQGTNDIMEDYYNTTYGAGTATDSSFFIQSTGLETVYAPNGPCTDGPCTDEYDINIIPEPGTMVLLGFGLALLSGVVLRRRLTA